MVSRKKPKAGMTSGICVACLAALLCACGIFSPRQSAEPHIGASSDKLSFSTIGGTQYPFSSLQFETLFQGEDPIYIDANSGPQTKTTLIQRLNVIAALPNISINWNGGTGVTWTPNNDTMVTVNVAKYYIKSGNSPLATDSGSSIFTLVQSSGWHISNWKDFPAAGASFFSPDYSQ
jgi:hypothetical protein